MKCVVDDVGATANEVDVGRRSAGRSWWLLAALVSVAVATVAWFAAAAGTPRPDRPGAASRSSAVETSRPAPSRPSPPAEPSDWTLQPVPAGVMPRTTAQQAIATVRRDGPIWDDHANVRALLAYLTIETYGGPGHPTYMHVLTWIVQLDPITVAASCPTARGCPPPQPGIAQVAIDATTGKYLLGRTFGAAHPPAGRQYAGAPLTTDQAADAEWDQP